MKQIGSKCAKDLKDDVPSYFKNYILDLYELKSKTTGIEKRINKSLLNNLLGRFGLNIIKPVTKLIKNENLDFLLVLLSCSCFCP